MPPCLPSGQVGREGQDGMPVVPIGGLAARKGRVAEDVGSGRAVLTWVKARQGDV